MDGERSERYTARKASRVQGGASTPSGRQRHSTNAALPHRDSALSQDRISLRVSAFMLGPVGAGGLRLDVGRATSRRGRWLAVRLATCREAIEGEQRGALTTVPPLGLIRSFMSSTEQRAAATAVSSSTMRFLGLPARRSPGACVPTPGRDQMRSWWRQLQIVWSLRSTSCAALVTLWPSAGRPRTRRRNSAEQPCRANCSPWCRDSRLKRSRRRRTQHAPGSPDMPVRFMPVRFMPVRCSCSRSRSCEQEAIEVYGCRLGGGPRCGSCLRPPRRCRRQLPVEPCSRVSAWEAPPPPSLACPRAPRRPQHLRTAVRRRARRRLGLNRSGRSRRPVWSGGSPRCPTSSPRT